VIGTYALVADEPDVEMHTVAASLSNRLQPRETTLLDGVSATEAAARSQ